MERPALGKRIIIVGCPGSGKSFLAKRLHRITGLPLFHLDNVWWKADRTHVTQEEFDIRLQTILQSEEWIIDGDYSRTYEPRFLFCDTVIYLDYSKEECMDGIMERIGKDRADMPWTEQQLDPELAELVRRYRADNRPVLYGLIEEYPGKKVFIFRTRAEVQSWVSSLFSVSSEQYSPLY